MEELGIDVEFVQDNHSRSVGPVLRGIHLQRGQAKLVRCPRGPHLGRRRGPAARLPHLPAAGRATSSTTSTHRQLFIPDGFGHGFCVLSDEADVALPLSDYYDPELETGIAWDDPEIGIEWPISRPDPVRARPRRPAPGRARRRLGALARQVALGLRAIRRTARRAGSAPRRTRPCRRTARRARGRCRARRARWRTGTR